MKNGRIVIYGVGIVVLLLGILIFSVSRVRNDLPDWAIGYFVGQEDENLIFVQDTSSNFYCPAIDENVKWESGGISHPAAVVHKDKVVLLYQVEDDLGEKSNKILPVSVISYFKHDT